jgi:hypothetical protein
VVGAFVLLTGCSDPVEGNWESDNEVLCGNGTVEHVSVVIDGDGTGFGDVCSCNFTFSWAPLTDDRYRFDVDFDNGVECGLAADGEYDCKLRNKEKLDCDDALLNGSNYIKVQ